DLDQWEVLTGGLKYRYGAAHAPVNAELGVSTLEKTYVTNRAGTGFLDYDTTTFDYVLFYNYSPKTSALLDFTRGAIRFDSVGSRGADGLDYRIRAGLRWIATAKTSGDIRVGMMRRTFSDINAEDVTGFSWQATVNWNPLSRSLVELRTARSIEQTYRADSRGIDVRLYGVALTHTLTSRLKSRLDVSRTDSLFIGNPTERNDRSYAASLRGDLQLSRILSLFARATYEHRYSTDDRTKFGRAGGQVGFRIAY
ncbi:MAG TPA: outer membrane beta-barrel protein, partial [Candidatus Binatia bacterium]|nr:outer membrane beta-barrel protein [Candidatus Binatia bacterium]